MLLMHNIVREGHPSLRKQAKPVLTPISAQDRKTLLSLLEYIIASQNEELRDKYQLREAVGIAAPQIKVNKRMFAIHGRELDGTLYSMALINPVITKHSNELVYLPGGEGCLSVDRETTGLTERFASITFKALKYDFLTKDFQEIEMTLTGYIAIVFQHEYDHLDGILYTDKLTDNPQAKPLFEIST